ncbi:pantetheine-phosphate adenylyltransferase [Lentisphaerota bacterium WC36G]|nr:pantetheine-phosphate adenylyltransferase [Lentisphaerae bacterium WC36]
MTKKAKTVLYPGSFDPVTNGHLDLIERASLVFDTVFVAVAINHEKNPMFTIEERVNLLKQVTAKYDNVKVVSFTGLLVDAVEEYKVSAILRGLRAFSDFEYELQMALMNRRLKDDCETLFMMPSTDYSFVSSRLVREIAKCDGDFRHFVQDVVYDAVKAKIDGIK